MRGKSVPDKGISPQKGPAKGLLAIRRLEKTIEDLRRSNRDQMHFKMILERSSYGCGVLDPKGRLVYINRAFARMHGYKVTDLLGRHVSCLHTPTQMRNVRRLLRQLRYRGTIVSEVWHKRKDGSVLPALMHGMLIRNRQGQPNLVVGIAIDMTEYHRTKQALWESEQKYRTLVESAGEAIAVVGKDGRLEFINKIGAARLGGRPEHYVDRSLHKVFPKPFADRHLAVIRQVIKSRRGITTITTSELQGQTRWYGTTINPLKDITGKVTRALIVARDIHDIKEAQEQLEGRRDQMCRTARLASLGVMRATMVHELTQPLTVINLSIEQAMAQLQDSEGPKADLREAFAAVQKALSLVDRYRRIARSTSHKTPKRVDVKTVAERIVALLSRPVQQSGIQICLKKLTGLPRIWADEADVEQIFFALIQNAIQAANGRSDLRLTVSGRTRGSWLCLRFSDSCGGISPEHEDRVWEPFFTTKAAGQGTGLGLPIVERIVSEAQGRVGIKNDWPRGVTFCVDWRLDRRLR